jgi:predicted N-formylglutamate amidohydrolase
MTLLRPGEPSPAIVQNPGAASPFLLLGDHAGRRIPRSLGDLGLPRAELTRHIAWDIGVADLGARLSRTLDATFVRQRYSRLVVDCNRSPDKHDWIAAVSDGAAIPGNADLTPVEIQARHDEVYAPYHRRIAAVLDRQRPRALISLHSFTPTMAGFARPWRFGVLHKDDSPLSRAALRLLKAALGEAAGDNQPYRMDEVDHTIPFHAQARGLDYLELEVRQDLISNPEGQRQVAAFLEPLLRRGLELAGAPDVF